MKTPDGPGAKNVSSFRSRIAQNKKCFPYGQIKKIIAS